MNANRNKILFCIMCVSVIFLQAQTSLNLYPLNGTIGVKFFSEKKISLEPRIDFQLDFVNGESNMFVYSELYSTVNFLWEDKFNMYTGIGLGANVYNQAQSNFTGAVPIGATYYLTDSRRIALVGECGVKITALDYIKIKTYALIGIRIGLKKITQK